MSQSNGTEGLLALPDEVLKRIASQLHDPNQLLTLALACKHFKKVVEGAAQTFIDVCATDEERNNLPPVDLPVADSKKWVGRNWGVIDKYQVVLKHRESLRFDQIVGDVGHKEGDKSTLRAIPGRMIPIGMSVPIGMGSSNRIMRSGVHRAIFEFDGPARGSVMIGIDRPMDYNNKTLYEDPHRFDPSDDGIEAKYLPAWQGENQVNVVLWSSGFGTENILLCRGQNNENRRLRNDRLKTAGRVGFLLDMDNGTLARYMNGNHVSTITIATGLVGEYVWIVCLGPCSRRNKDTSVRICEWD
mmetsp:Transcript_25087/g.46217  ORF Transcript_25087/g.46217 Transcript_25087/m.46217 type:complete len:301 (+) Transcript_25087:104-1006(+)